MILDSEPYRYRNFISDIAGQDIHVHAGDSRQAITEVRNWLAAASGRRALPGSAEIVTHFQRFQTDLPKLCKRLRRVPTELTFVDLSEVISIWLRGNR